MEANTPPIIHRKHPRRFSFWPPMMLLIIFLLVFFWNGLMVKHWDATPVRWMTAILPVPAAIVNGDFVTYHALLKRKDVLVWSQGTAGNEEPLFSAAMEVLIDQTVIRQIAEKMEVQVNREDVVAVGEKLMQGLSDTEYKQKIRDELQMSERVFSRTVLEPLALAQKLEQAVLASSDEQEAPRAEALGVLASLKAGQSFSDLASAHSDDPSSSSGGDMGYVTSQTLPEGWEALLELAEGEHTSVIDAERAFVIAEATWVIGAGDDVQIRTRAIIIKKRGLTEVVADYLAQSKVNQLIRLDE